MASELEVLNELLKPRNWQEMHQIRTAILRARFPGMKIHDERLPRNGRLEIWSYSGFEFHLRPFGGPSFKRFYVTCPVCRGQYEVGHFFQHVRVHS